MCRLATLPIALRLTLGSRPTARRFGLGTLYERRSFRQPSKESLPLSAVYHPKTHVEPLEIC
ncbi:hypothetical protein BN1723_001858 [Verticillium longisporum]|uniref:Uncharacterized protein n=1 Tax=Verticillium longisporum TaxID=100787 RepID=A0A0G4KS50_VERLO|nr:hypothetical protein BN1723_001858 [Verticillium longisporum]